MLINNSIKLMIEFPGEVDLGDLGFLDNVQKSVQASGKRKKKKSKKQRHYLSPPPIIAESASVSSNEGNLQIVEGNRIKTSVPHPETPRKLDDIKFSIMPSFESLSPPSSPKTLSFSVPITENELTYMRYYRSLFLERRRNG